MRSFPSLFRQFILRAMAREKTRTSIAVVGIALGVAVMLAVRLANRSVTAAFRAAVDATAGDASLRLRGTAGRFDETLLAGLLWLTHYGAVSPVVETYARVAPPGEPEARATPADRGEVLHVLGVDVLVDSPVRRYRLLRTSRDQRDPTPREVLRLLTEPDAIVLTVRFARRVGLQIGDPIRLAFGSTRREFRIRGLLLDEGPARALDGNFALLDLAAAQWAADRLGRLDHVDLKLRPGLDPREAADEIRRRLPEGLVVESPSARFERADAMIDAFHFNLSALSGIALVVGLFLIYNTVSVSVAARREEIGILQAVGAGRGTVVALFLGEAALIGAVGTALGILLGGWLAGAAVIATSQTVETFFIAEVAQTSARRVWPGWEDVALAVGVTMPLGLAAAAVPALRAAAVQPVEVIRGAERIFRSFRPPRRALGWAALLAAMGWLLTRLGPVHGRPVFGFVAQLALMLAGAMLVPGVLWLACRAVRAPAAAALGGVWLPSQLAASNLLGAISRVSISVAALAVSLAMMVAVSVMVGSFRETVVYWLRSTLQADLFVRPVQLASSVGEARIERSAVERIRRDPDVAATGFFTSRQLPYGETAIRIAGVDLATVLAHGVLLYKSPDDAESAVRRAASEDRVLVSESFSLRFGKRPGDLVSVPTPQGPREFPVAAIYYDYASNQGTVLVDGRTWRRYFGDDPAATPSSLSIYLRPGADAEAVRARIARAAGPEQDLYFATSENVRQEAMRIFDSTFTITYALEVIAIVIAALGVVSTLIALIYERQREIALLSLVGATPRQVRAMVVVEAVLIGGVSQLLGILLGLVLALVLIYVINVQSFGWTIQFHMPWQFLVESTVLILAATALCGLYPAARAANIRALEIVREE